MPRARLVLPYFAHAVLRRALAAAGQLPGVWRVRHWALDHERAGFPERPVRCRLADGSAIWVRPNDPIGRAIFYTGLFEGEFAQAFRAAVRPGDTVLDVGANVGQFTLLAARAAGPGGRVVAVEPGAGALELLRANIEANGLKTVTVLPVAAWDADTTLHFQGATEAMLGWGHVAAAPAAAGTAVPARRLDAALADLGVGKVDVVKIDVEGAECQAVHGLAGLLQGAGRPRAVYCEVGTGREDRGSQPADVIDFLAGLGYADYEPAGPPGRRFDRRKLDGPFCDTILFAPEGA